MNLYINVFSCHLKVDSNVDVILMFSGSLLYVVVIVTCSTGLPLLWNFWKPGNVGEFCKGQGKGTESGNLIVTPWQYVGNKTVMCMDTCSDRHISYLYFVRTLMHFAYLMFSLK